MKVRGAERRRAPTATTRAACCSTAAQSRSPSIGRRQAGGRRSGLHEQRALRCIPRVRPGAGDPRRRVGDGRARPAPRHRPVRAAAHQRGERRRPVRTTARRRPSRTSSGELRTRPVPRPRARRPSRAATASPRRRPMAVGEGMAVAMIATMAPFGHIAETTVTPPRRPLLAAVGTTEFGNGTTTVHTQIVATDLATTADPRRAAPLRHRRVRYDTGAFAFGRASPWPARPCTRHPSPCATACWRLPAASPGRQAPSSGTGAGAVRRLIGFAELVDAAPQRVARRRRRPPPAASTASTVAGVQRARGASRGRASAPERCGSCSRCRPPTPGYVMNPEQCVGQIEGGAAQGIGSALYEEVIRMPGTCQSGLPPVPGAAVRRHPGHRGLLRRHERRPRAVRGEVDERVALQPGRPGDRQRDRPRPRHPALRAAVLRDRVWRLARDQPSTSTVHTIPARTES